MDAEWRTTCVNVNWRLAGCDDFRKECGMWPQQCYGYSRCTGSNTTACCPGVDSTPTCEDKITKITGTFCNPMSFNDGSCYTSYRRSGIYPNQTAFKLNDNMFVFGGVDWKWAGFFFMTVVDSTGKWIENRRYATTKPFKIE
jgi:hypothetical protein